MTLSLSTMWAQQERFVADMHAFVDEARALGYDAIEVSHSTALAQFERLMGYRDVPISSIHAPAPLVRDEAGRANGTLNLACTDEAECRAAIDYTKRTIGLTREAGGNTTFLARILRCNAAGPLANLELERLSDSGQFSAQLSKEEFQQLQPRAGEEVYVELKNVKVFADDYSI